MEVYVPPLRVAARMEEEEEEEMEMEMEMDVDESSVEYQRLTWDALRKSIIGIMNKVNAANIKYIIPQLFAENLIRGRGLFCRFCIKSQMASPRFTNVYSALVAVVNTKFPQVVQLLLKRLVLQLKRAYKTNNKPHLLSSTNFIAHLVNQQVAHEIIALELLTLLLQNPTDDTVEVAVGFVTECGALLHDLSPRALDAVFERFRAILHQCHIGKRVQFLIEALFALRKSKFQAYPALLPELDLVEHRDELTHDLSLLDDHLDPEISLDFFNPDPLFIEHEKHFQDLQTHSDSVSDSDCDSEQVEGEDSNLIKDETHSNLVHLRRTIYLTIMSSLDFEQAGHSLLNINLEPGQEIQLCIMLLECCTQDRTYLPYYGLLAQRFCAINTLYQQHFHTCFLHQYSMVHRLVTNQLRNLATFYAHLLTTDAIPWHHVLPYLRLTEQDTTSSSRIFIKILFQQLSHHLGLPLLNQRLADPALLHSLDSIFPKDSPSNSRFSINFFTSIGLGGITLGLRDHLNKSTPKRKAISLSDGHSPLPNLNSVCPEMQRKRRRKTTTTSSSE